MAKIYIGDEIKIHLDCKEDVNGQTDLVIRYKKPISGTLGEWPADGVGDYADYDTTQEDLDERGTWEVQPWSDTHDVHGDVVDMPVFMPLFVNRTDSIPAYLVGA